MPRPRLQTPNFRMTTRADGYKIIRYVVDGKQYNKSTGTKDATEAEAFRARFAEEFKRPKLDSPTVAEICDAYVEDRKAVVRHFAPFAHPFKAVKRHLGALFPEQATQSAVNRYIATRRNERVPNRKNPERWGDRAVSDATISKELRLFRAALRWAVAERVLPAESEPRFRVEISSGGRRDRWITKEEAARLVDAAPPHLALFVTIALNTAKRREAILDLTWDRVNLDRPGHEFIDFGDDRGNKRRGGSAIAGMTRLLAALREAQGRAKTRHVIEFRGKPVKDVKSALKTACRDAGIDPPIGAHALKHTAITWMVQAGKTFEEISKATNTSAKIIEEVYGHHSPEFVRGIADAVAF